ncbi:MAG: hypothetical protein A3B70_07145 [Deltaproteobacteria bacterium RIFCSPHIGHO2_02_FULL_40_11]|nr:MAG: hypothetical protein A3B70_07145 [Deltaproteobacteria bacterium RIFCSPHIGHO2_02_FULL_40_11]
MKKYIYVFLSVVFFASSVHASNALPEDMTTQLLSKVWSGTMTTDSPSGAKGYHSLVLNFTKEEDGALTGMITLFGVKIGNGVFNPSEFLHILYETDALMLSYLDPKTRENRDTYTLRVTHHTESLFSGLVYLTTADGTQTWKIGTFRVQ